MKHSSSPLPHNFMSNFFLVCLVQNVRIFIKDYAAYGPIIASLRLTSMSKKAWLIGTDITAPSRVENVDLGKRCSIWPPPAVSCWFSPVLWFQINSISHLLTSRNRKKCQGVYSTRYLNYHTYSLISSCPQTHNVYGVNWEMLNSTTWMKVLTTINKCSLNYEVRYLEEWYIQNEKPLPIFIRLLIFHRKVVKTYLKFKLRP